MTQRQPLLSPEFSPRRLAAIDIGSNSIRLIIAEQVGDRDYRILDDEKESTRLGRSLAATGRLDPEAVGRSLAVLRHMKQIAAGYQIDILKAIATCAVREAEDGPEFCRRCQEEIGLEIEVISSRDEALLALSGVQRAFHLEQKNVAVVDIGGGSTEVVLASDNVVEEIYSTPLGAVRVTDLFGGAQPLGTAEFEALLGGVQRKLRKHLGKPLFVPHVMVGSGGTFTSLAALVMAARGQESLPVQGYQLTRADVWQTLNRLRKLPPGKRKAVPGMSPDRVDIIVGGLAVIDRLMQLLQVNLLQVHTGGVRDGLLLKMLGGRPGDATVSLQARSQAIDHFAARCGVDLKHGKQVARLAASLHSQLAQAFGLDPADRELLEIAAQLQDVGYLISYDKHHKHSFHLILNSRLPGLQARDLETIALVARYHRGSAPRSKHDVFRRLSRKERRRICELAAILRLAGGLDRSHSQIVSDVRVAVGPRHVDLTLEAPEAPDLDLWGARRRTELFEEVFDCQVRIAWEGETQRPEPAEAPAVEPPPQARREQANAAPSGDAKPPKRRRKKSQQVAGD